MTKGIPLKLLMSDDSLINANMVEQNTVRLEDKPDIITTLYSILDLPILAGISALVGYESFITQNNDTISAIKTALLKASEYAKNNPE